MLLCNFILQSRKNVTKYFSYLNLLRFRKNVPGLSLLPFIVQCTAVILDIFRLEVVLYVWMCIITRCQTISDSSCEA